MNNLMVDLETLGTSARAPILSIGAVFFDPQKKVLGNTFYAILDCDEQIKNNRQVDFGTIKWWLNQNKDARAEFEKKGHPVKATLSLFREWILKNTRQDTYIWANGTSFDVTILEDIFRQYVVEVPWKYNKIMDLRTYKKFIAPMSKIEKVGTTHNALQDAINQANFILKTYPKKEVTKSNS